MTLKQKALRRLLGCYWCEEPVEEVWITVSKEDGKVSGVYCSQDCGERDRWGPSMGGKSVRKIGMLFADLVKG